MTVAEIKDYIEQEISFREEELKNHEIYVDIKDHINFIDQVKDMLDQLDEQTMSRHSATFLTCRIIDELDVPNSVAETIEQKLMSGKFEEVEKYYVERKKWLEENRVIQE